MTCILLETCTEFKIDLSQRQESSSAKNKNNIIFLVSIFLCSLLEIKYKLKLFNVPTSINPKTTKQKKPCKAKQNTVQIIIVNYCCK